VSYREYTAYGSGLAAAFAALAGATAG